METLRPDAPVRLHPDRRLRWTDPWVDSGPGERVGTPPHECAARTASNHHMREKSMKNDPSQRKDSSRLPYVNRADIDGVELEAEQT